MLPFMGAKTIVRELGKEYWPVLWLLATLVAVSLIWIGRGGVAVADEVDCCECCEKEKQKKADGLFCEEGWPCRGNLLCPAESKHDPDEMSYHEGPCFCLEKGGMALVWVMEMEVSGRPIGGKRTDWGTCRAGSKAPYCRIDSKDLTVCGSGLIQWLRYLTGWFEELYGKNKEG